MNRLVGLEYGESIHKAFCTDTSWWYCHEYPAKVAAPCLTTCVTRGETWWPICQRYDSCTYNPLQTCFPKPYFLHDSNAWPSKRADKSGIKPLSNSRGLVSPGSAAKTSDLSCTLLQGVCEIDRHHTDHTVVDLHQSHLNIWNMSIHVTGNLSWIPRIPQLLTFRTQQKTIQ